MRHRTKQIATLSLAAALVALLLLVASLSELRLQAGSPFPGGGNGSAVTAERAIQTRAVPGSVPLVEAILAGILLLLVIYLPARMVGLISVRRVLGLVAAFLILLALLSILPRVTPGGPSSVPEETSNAAARPTAVYPVSPLGQPPLGFMWLTAAGLMLGAGLLTMQLLKRTAASDPGTDALLQEAENALRDLKAGKDFPDVIVRCYIQMTEILRTEQGLERHQSMTVREFQDWLQLKGIPPAPVQQLTSLFEKARYGQEHLEHSDEERGAECLKQIIRYCRKENAES